MTRRQLYWIRFHVHDGGWYVETTVGRVGGPFTRRQDAVDDADSRARLHEPSQVSVYDRKNRLVEERVFDVEVVGVDR